MESKFERTTRECRSLTDMRPDLLSSMRAMAEKYELGTIDANVLACCETTSVPRKKHGQVKEGEVQHTGIVVTPEFLWWAMAWRGRVTAYWARLEEIEVGDYRNSPEYDLVHDSGIDLFGFVMRGRERGSVFIGLGEGEAADRLRVVLGEAVEKAGGIWKQ